MRVTRLWKSFPGRSNKKKNSPIAISNGHANGMVKKGSREGSNHMTCNLQRATVVVPS